jgi:hypothetical protein
LLVQYWPARLGLELEHQHRAVVPRPQLLAPALADERAADPLAHEHRPDQLAGRLPGALGQLPVGRSLGRDEPDADRVPHLGHLRLAVVALHLDPLEERGGHALAAAQRPGADPPVIIALLLVPVEPDELVGRVGRGSLAVAGPGHHAGQQVQRARAAQVGQQPAVVRQQRDVGQHRVQH